MNAELLILILFIAFLLYWSAFIPIIYYHFKKIESIATKERPKSEQKLIPSSILGKVRIILDITFGTIVSVMVGDIILNWNMIPAICFLQSIDQPNDIFILGYLLGIIGISYWLITTFRQTKVLRALNVFPYKAIPSEHKLITNGPYKRCRHPFYGAHIISYSGWFLITWFWPFLFFILAIIVIDFKISQAEEILLISIYGEEYIQYKQHTRRFF